MLERGFERTLDGARGGTAWAWEAIYSELAPPVLSYLRASRAPEPEDLLGEVFLQVVRDLGRFSGGERDFRTWVLTIAHHRLIDARRRANRRPVVADVEAAEAAMPRGDVEREALERFDTERVRELLDALTAEQRAVLLLRIVGDLSVEQVARALGKRAGAVKQLQRRGLLAVRRELEREGVTR